MLFSTSTSRASSVRNRQSCDKAQRLIKVIVIGACLRRFFEYENSVHLPHGGMPMRIARHDMVLIHSARHCSPRAVGWLAAICPVLQYYRSQRALSPQGVCSDRDPRDEDEGCAGNLWQFGQRPASSHLALGLYRCSAGGWRGDRSLRGHCLLVVRRLVSCDALRRRGPRGGERG